MNFETFNLFACNFHLLQEVTELLQTDCVVQCNFWPSCQLLLEISTDYGSVAKAFLEDLHCRLPDKTLLGRPRNIAVVPQGFGFSIQVLVQM